jgi:hypothetical protein
MRETCGCGAEWAGGSAYVEEREKFRAAHAACREGSPRYTLSEVKEALLGEAEKLERPGEDLTAATVRACKAQGIRDAVAAAFASADCERGESK